MIRSHAEQPAGKRPKSAGNSNQEQRLPGGFAQGCRVLFNGHEPFALGVTQRAARVQILIAVRTLEGRLLVLLEFPTRIAAARTAAQVHPRPGIGTDLSHKAEYTIAHAVFKRQVRDSGRFDQPGQRPRQKRCTAVRTPRSEHSGTLRGKTRRSDPAAALPLPGCTDNAPRGGIAQTG